MSLIAEYFFTFIIFILPIIYVVQPFFMQGFGKIISSESVEILKRKKLFFIVKLKSLKWNMILAILKAKTLKIEEQNLKAKFH